MNAASIAGLITALSATGPVGLTAMILGGLGLLGSVLWYAYRAGQTTDDDLLDRAGADAGLNATDLKNQLDRVRDHDTLEKAEILKAGPPPEEKS